MNAHLARRFWEIDLLRGIAIVMMIAFHGVYDLNYFGGAVQAVHSGFWFFVARATATIFLLLVGISLTLSYARALATLKTENPLFRKYLLRGLKIFSWGLVLTATTWLFLRETFIVWGILHLIGIAIVLAYPLVQLRYVNLVLGAGIVALGIGLKNATVTVSWLLWLGLTPAPFQTLDYFPLLPWFGVVLIGVFIGNSLYSNYARHFTLHDLSQFAVIRFLTFLGRHSLFIYLVHQPVLILVLYLLGLANIGLLSVPS